MSCCGDQRASLRQQLNSSTEGRSAEFWTPGEIDFEYSGDGELTVTGPLSGIVYRFTVSDRRVRIHGSDAPSLLSVPGIRPVH